MKSRLSQLGMAIALGLLVTVGALLLVVPTQARPSLAGGTLLGEGFENAAFPPADWQLNVITGTSAYTWTRVSSGSSPAVAPHGGGWMASYYSSQAPPGFATRLATPVLDFSSLTSPDLRFWMSHDAGSGADRLRIDLSTDGGMSYTDVLTTVYRNDGSSGWKLHTVDLSPYIGQANVRLGFVGISTYSYNIYVDDVTVGDPAPSYVAQKSVAPIGPRYTEEAVTYTIVLTNVGNLTGTAALNDPIPANAQVVPDSMTGGAVYSDVLNAVVWSPISLAPHNSVTTTFRVTLTATNGSVTNTAAISDAAIFAPVSASAASAMAVADFSASAKTVSGNLHPTGPLTYTVVLYNSLAAITATTTMTDPIPAGVVYRPGSASVQGGGTLLADTAGITWTGSVTGGQKITVTFGVSLTVLTGNVTNTVYINSPNINSLVSKAASIAVQPYSGGPDLFGYTYRDSYAPGGPSFTWVEPLTTSKLITFAGGGTNDGFYQVNLPFPFAFYTNIYTQVYPSTNGLVGFGAGSTTAANTTIPTSGAPNNFAACYWDDLRIWATSPITEGVYFETTGVAPNRIAILTFALEDAYYSAGSTPPYRFQMLLTEGTNQMTCQYQQMTSATPRGSGQSATAGIENASGIDGLRYFYGSGLTLPAPIEDRLAIRYTPPQRPNYAVAKTVQPAGQVYSGQVLTYSLTITNFGALAGTATISDPLPAGVVFIGPVSGDPLQPTFDGYAVTWTGPVLNAQSVTARFLARVLPSLSGWITNTATISDSLIPTPLTAQVSTAVARPIYTTSSKTVTPSGVVNPGQLLTYTVSIVNSGQLSGTASLIDAVPEGAAYVFGSATIVSGGGSIVEDSKTITWTGTVTNSATIQVRLNAFVSGRYGVITNTATITDAAMAAPVTVFAANTIASPDLSASTKTADPAAVQAGGALTYTVLVKNTGLLTSTAASLTDALSPQVTLDPIGLSASSGIVTGTPSAVSWTGTVAPGTSVTVTIPVAVSNNCCGQVLTNTAVISDPIHPVPVVAAAAPVLVYGSFSPLNESFEDVTFPPAGWAAVVVTPTASVYWTQVITGEDPVIPSGPYAGGYMARYNSFSASFGVSARLSTPDIDLTGASTPLLVFAMYHDPGYPALPGDRIQIQVSTDGGSTYDNIGAPIIRYAAVAGWGLHTVDLSAYRGQSIRIGFLAISSYGNDMFIDAVGIYACGFAPAGVGFTFNPTLPLAGQSIAFDGSVLTGTAPFTYTWNFGDGSPLLLGDPVTHDYAVNGTYLASLTVSNQYGSASYSTSVVVNAVPALTLVSSSPTILGHPTYFTATLQAGSLPITYTWDFGDGTIVNAGLIVNHTYAVGTYTAILTATNSYGSAVYSLPINVLDTPIVGLTAGNSSPTRVGQVTFLTATIASGSHVTYTWDLGDTTSSAGALTSHFYQAGGIYTATVTAINGVSVTSASTVVTILALDTTTTTLTSSANPVMVSQAVTFTATVAPLAATGMVQFYAAGAPLASAVVLANGIAQVSTAALPLGIHVITATYSGDANHLASTAAPLNQVVQSTAVCIPVTGTTFSFVPSVPTLGQPVNFTASILGGTLPVTYTWNFGYGADVITTMTSIVHSFPVTNTTQSYTTTLAVTNACSTQAAQPQLVTVQPARVYLPLILK